MNCQNCNTIIENGYALCTACELRFAGTLLRLARDVTPLHDSLDATLHPGGHSPTRIQTATPPTPIRLDVLDLIDAKAEGYANDFNGNLESLVSEIQQSFASMHRNAISDAHEDFEEVVEGEAFKEWLASLDEPQRVKAEQVVESGSAGQIIKLLGQFKDFVAEKDKPKEKTPEDIWAEDAASSIRSSSPLKLPTRAPGSDDDEYKRAFNEA